MKYNFLLNQIVHVTNNDMVLADSPNSEMECKQWLNEKTLIGEIVATFDQQICIRQPDWSKPVQNNTAELLWINLETEHYTVVPMPQPIQMMGMERIGAVNEQSI